MTTATATLPRTSADLLDALIRRRGELADANRAELIAAGDARRAQAEAAGITDPDHLELEALRGIRAASPLQAVADAMSEIHRAERLERVARVAA